MIERSSAFCQSGKISTNLVALSVTRFGEISPLKQKFRTLWQYFKGLFGIGQSCEPTVGQFVFFWANFHCCKRPNLEKQSGHTVQDGNGKFKFCFCHPPWVTHVEHKNYFTIQCKFILVTKNCLHSVITWPWSSLVVGDEGWIGPSKKLETLWNRCMA